MSLTERNAALKRFMENVIQGKEPLTDRALGTYQTDLSRMIVSDDQAHKIVNRLIELGQQKSPEFKLLLKFVHNLYYKWDILAELAEKRPEFTGIIEESLANAMLGDYEEIEEHLDSLVKKFPKVAGPMLLKWKQETDERLDKEERQEKLEEAEEERQYQEDKEDNDVFFKYLDLENQRD